VTPRLEGREPTVRRRRSHQTPPLTESPAVRAVQIHEFGGPESLVPTEVPDAEPSNGQVLVRVSRAGVNFADTHAIRDEYVVKQELPLVPGMEVSGTTEDGRRVAAITPAGGYAELACVPEWALVPIPDDVDDEQAAALLAQGLTAWGTLAVAARLQPGETVVVHAAAGGVGSLAVQLARRLGAGRVIGLASTEEKRELVRELGADATADSRADDLREAIVESNEGRPVDVVLEMTGGACFEGSLAACAPFGRVVTFGISSREQNKVGTARLLRRSGGVLGFFIWHLFERPELLRQGTSEVFGAAAAGDLRAVIGGVYPLSEARRAHEELASRRSRGKLLLDPSR
jgi:NADPH:quinone reductase